MESEVAIDSSVGLGFICKNNKQKVLIDILLKYSQQDLKGIAFILDILVRELVEVYLGKKYLYGEPAEKLAQLFLIFFES